MNKENDYFEANQKLWDAKTRIHLSSDFYDMDTFRKTRNSLNPIEQELLGDVQGLSLLHSQCHFGQDTLSLQNLGAECVGFDLSPAAIGQAQELNKELGLDANFLVSNIYDLHKNLNQQFDLVFTSYGVIAWLPDMNRWAEQLMSRLKSGGTFVMVEFHPTLYMYDWDKNEIGYTYFNGGNPTRDVEQGTYADRAADITLEEYFWQHSLAEVMNALISHGLNIEHLGEHDSTPYNIFREEVLRGPKEYLYQINGINIPCLFSIKGKKR